MPYSSIGAAKAGKFLTTLGGVSLTLAQINNLAAIYDSIKAKGGVEEPMAVAIATFKKKYTKKGNSWVAKESEQEQSAGVELTSVEELPDPAQAVWNEVYQQVVKKLKGEGVDLPIAKTRARHAAMEHVSKYWDYDEDTRKWTKKPKE